MKVGLKMNKSDANKVVSHIDEAKNWLDAAKAKYSQSNRVGGELNLNLAQAEVKYAWELSRRQNVISTVPTTPPRRARKYFPAAAACFLIFLGLTGGLYWAGRNSKGETPTLTVKSNPQPREVARTPAADQQIAVIPKATEKPRQVKTGGDATVSQVKWIKPVSSGSCSTGKKLDANPKIVKTEEIKAEKIRKVPTPETVAKTLSLAVSETVVKAEQSTITNNQDNLAAVDKSEKTVIANVNPIEPALVPKAPKISMATLVIDEEALTKEASYSLKNGK
jgi:hypothetical protein